ncbi:hypothetical protein EJ06DRAFT_285740 [Trichodelitschia bisporula]|uniref:Uncharacterized protein n=1 Tax=Trichodelitschia bisporula TaxID=703511 RepID=A0A6G1I5R1_9PEZI|nr:hypothetical protein EJ06DRAFT_285740 [Trichodelitschia bisporula]
MPTRACIAFSDWRAYYGEVLGGRFGASLAFMGWYGGTGKGTEGGGTAMADLVLFASFIASLRVMLVFLRFLYLRRLLLPPFVLLSLLILPLVDSIRFFRTLALNFFAFPYITRKRWEMGYRQGKHGGHGWIGQGSRTGKGKERFPSGSTGDLTSRFPWPASCCFHHCASLRTLQPPAARETDKGEKLQMHLPHTSRRNCVVSALFVPAFWSTVRHTTT